MDNTVAFSSITDADKRLLKGVVMAPDVKDFDGDSVSAEQIETYAHDWLCSYKALDVDHDFVVRDSISVVESYVTSADEHWNVGEEDLIVTKGSWVICVKIADDDVWDRVKNRELTGFSVAAFKKTDIDFVQDYVLKSKSGDRTTFSDLGHDNMFIPLISLVDDPALAEAKFLSIKNAENDEGGLFKLFKTFLKKLNLDLPIASTDADDLYVSDVEQSEEVTDMNEEQLIELITKVLDAREAKVEPEVIEEVAAEVVDAEVEAAEPVEEEAVETAEEAAEEEEATVEVAMKSSEMELIVSAIEKLNAKFDDLEVAVKGKSTKSADVTSVSTEGVIDFKAREAAYMKRMGL